MRLPHFFEIEVRYADPPDFPFFLQLSHCCPAFFKILRGPVNLIEIDYIHIQPKQTVFALAANGLRLQVSVNVALFVPPQTTFGENVWPTSRPRFQRGSDDFLGVAHSINGCRVDPVNAKVERAMDRRDGRLVILLAPTKFPTRSADSSRSETDRCYEQIGVTEALCFYIRLRFRFHVFCSHRSNLPQFMDCPMLLVTISRCFTMIGCCSTGRSLRQVKRL